MICKVRETISKFSMLKKGDKVIVGFSGGADSMCLLYILNSLKDEIGFSIIAAHVNHCLRGEESERDEDFVRRVCGEMGIELKVKKADILKEARENSKGIEEYAREVRYDFFNSLADNSSKIATAHNLNDCEETMLFNLARGSALKGLTSIPPVRGNVIRPLIECSRSEIEDFCKENSIDFVTDSSNLSDDYTRNKIRHNVIPVLKELNPAFDSAVLRCIQSLRDDEQYLNECAQNLYEEIRTDFFYDAEKLKNTSDSLKKRVISKIIFDKCSVVPEKKHIDLALSVLDGGKCELFGGEKLIVNHGKLYFASDIETYEISEKEIIFNSDSFWSEGKIMLRKSSASTQKVYKELVLWTIDWDKIKGKLTLRSRREGDRIILPVRKVGKSLKKLFNEMKIEPEKRDSVLILSDDEGVVWVEGIGTDLRKIPDENTKNFLNISIMGDNNA